MSEPWLTKRELADELNTSTRTVDRHRLPAHARVGGQNRYLLSEVRRFLRGGPEVDRGDNVVELRPSRKGKAA